MIHHFRYMAIFVWASFGCACRETSDSSNAQIRMTKLEAMTNDQIAKIGGLLSSPLERYVSFVIRQSLAPP
jgi:hypothetical protein